jgi:hypothetical protein
MHTFIFHSKVNTIIDNFLKLDIVKLLKYIDILIDQKMISLCLATMVKGIRESVKRFSTKLSTDLVDK